MQVVRQRGLYGQAGGSVSIAKAHIRNRQHGQRGAHMPLVLLTAVMVSGALFTVRVKLCVAFEPTPFAAINVRLNVPVAVGVPDKYPGRCVQREIPPAAMFTLMLSVGVGVPVAVTANVPVVP